jgi:protein-S-isoprenylcysteine O-methyltransferase Ste14
MIAYAISECGMPEPKKKPMTSFGVGIKFTMISSVYLVLVLAVHFLWLSHLVVPLPRVLGQVLGVLLVITGIPIFLVSGLTIHKHFNDGKLATKGIYAYFRHPVYGSWIVFIVPGIVLLINSLIGLTAPFFMYSVFRLLIVKEDRYLEEKFGKAYDEYKKKVGEIFPKFWLKGG